MALDLKKKKCSELCASLLPEWFFSNEKCAVVTRRLGGQLAVHKVGLWHRCPQQRQPRLPTYLNRLFPTFLLLVPTVASPGRWRSDAHALAPRFRCFVALAIMP
eukprot:Hpha_TRINITY_DN15504_c0_g9::TRINITY_DN15504_c0_g9_i1::g.107067::m.107067